MATAWGRVIGNAASGSKENSHVVGENVCMANLFLDRNFIKMENFSWLDENSRSLDAR